MNEDALRDPRLIVNNCSTPQAWLAALIGGHQCAESPALLKIAEDLALLHSWLPADGWEPWSDDSIEAKRLLRRAVSTVDWSRPPTDQVEHIGAILYKPSARRFIERLRKVSP